MFVLGAIDVLIVVSALGFLDVGEAGTGYLNAVLGIGAVTGGFGVLALLTRGRLAAGVMVGAMLLGAGGGVDLGVREPRRGGRRDGGAGRRRRVPGHEHGHPAATVDARPRGRRASFGVVEAFAVIALALGSLGAGLLANAFRRAGGVRRHRRA